MDAKHYQELAAMTLLETPDKEYSDHEMMILWNAFGIAGETGEIVDHVKKAVFHQHWLDVAKLREELGDLLWYVAGMCTTLDLDLGDIMEDNIKKLRKRYPDGFNSEDSINRKE